MNKKRENKTRNIMNKSNRQTGLLISIKRFNMCHIQPIFLHDRNYYSYEQLKYILLTCPLG